jgi:hypothetical protein
MRSKQIFRRWAFFLVAFFLLAACDKVTVTLNELYDYPREIWGEWVRVDTGDLWRFGGNWRATGNTVGDDAVIEKQSENVVKITQEGKTDIYLFASRLPTASFSGRVVEMDGAASSVGGGRAISGIGGLPVVISNLDDRNNGVTVQTNDEGIYTADNIVIEDDYEVTVRGETTKVTVNTDGDDVGTITIVGNGVNFKTTLERRGASANQDMSCLWRNVSYYFNIVIENTGDEDCAPSYYTLAPGPGISLANTNLSGVLQTIEPGRSRVIPVEIVCNLVNGESENKKIDIFIDSPFDKRSWNDSVSLKFNREYVNLNIRSDGGAVSNAVSGIIIVPGAKAYSFTARSPGYQIRGAVPKYSGRDYLVVFSGASADNETFYSFSITGVEDGNQAAPNLAGFMDMVADEGSSGNDSEDTARHIADPSAGFRAFLRKNDVDFYKFRF